MMKRYERERAFWQHKLDAGIPVACFPYNINAESGAASDARFRKPLETAISERVQQVAGGSQLAVFLILLAGVEGLLHRYTGETDILLGVPVLREPKSADGGLNSLVFVANQVTGTSSLKSLFAAIKASVSEASEHQELPFWNYAERIPGTVGTEGGKPHIHTVIGYGPVHTQEFMKECSSDLVLWFDLEVPNQLTLDVRYNKRRYSLDAMERLHRHLQQLMSSLLGSPDLAIEDMSLITEEENESLLTAFQSTAHDYSHDKTLHALFEEQTARTPDRTAVQFGDSRLTYAELNARANRMAHRLRGHGVEPDTIVAIMTERSLGMITGIYGILKAGGAYLPIDPKLPEERIRYMLQDSGATVLLCQDEGHPVCANLAVTVLDLDPADASESAYPSSNPLSAAAPSNLAYVIYTSGSTGQPKGVMIEHHSVINRIQWMQKAYPLGEGDVILQKTPYAFDVSVWELFWWSWYGASLTFLEPGGEREPAQIVRTIIEQKVTTLHFVPPMLTAFLNYLEGDAESAKALESVKQVFASGEALPKHTVDRFFTILGPDRMQLVNLYGPTEATVDVSSFECKPGLARIPIGKPIDNIRLYVVDRSLRLLPVGIPGELCIAGVGLARGYLGRPELTCEKFIADPFVPGERMYRTGDLARWLPDGNVEYLGRMDHQVKIRGYRIELGEIEARLLEIEGIVEAAVIAEEDGSGEKQLFAYAVSGASFHPGSWKEELSRQLPAYMIPASLTVLEKLPLTLSGKLDRRALPKPETALRTGRAAYLAPRDETEAKLAEIWRQVLGLREIGVRDNFFELGGHSLWAARLTGAIYKEMNVELPIRDVFQAPTIELMAAKVREAKRRNYVPIPIAEAQEYYPVSSAQKRIYLLRHLTGGELGYNMPGVLEIRGPLDMDKAEAAFRRLILRHESLRTSFMMKEGEVVQRIHERVPFVLEQYAGDEEEAETMIRQFVRPFDLSRAPLLRAGLMKLGDDRHLLLFDTHHIIADGVSMSLLSREFIQCYQGEELQPLLVQYKDYAVWQLEQAKGDEMERHLAYWTGIFSDGIPVLELPTDHPRSAVRSFEGDTVSVKIDPSLLQGLQTLAQDSGATLFMVLLAVFNVLLSKYSRQQDIVVGTPVSGRDHPDVDSVMGMFVNTLSLRNTPKEELTFRDFLREVIQSSLEAFDHSVYPFEQLVEQVQAQRELSRNPLFDVMLVLQNMENIDLVSNELVFSTYPMAWRVSKFDLTLTLREEEEGLNGVLEYAASLFERETAERMAAHFVQLLGEAVREPDSRLGELNMLQPDETRQIQEVFNATDSEYPRSQTIHGLFEEQAARSPERVAVLFGDSRITYAELNAKANQIAHRLCGLGVQPDTVVAIMTERSLGMIAGIFGILKAGGAYLPIDPNLPAERIRYMLKDSGAVILLCQDQDHSVCAGFSGTVLDIEDSSLLAHLSSNLPQAAASSNLAYVIYTSGSTGQPKGVMIEHHSVINRLHWMQKEYPLSERDVILQKTPYTFDVSVWELFWWSWYGASLCFLEPGGEKDPAGIARTIAEHRVTTLHFVPPMLNAFLDHLEEQCESLNAMNAVKQVFASGEALPKHTVDRFFAILGQGRVKLVNLYGPTEATVDVTSFECKPGLVRIPIGKPIDNIRMHVMDRQLRPLPIGIPGELCISGAGLARGYLGRPELTDEKFVLDPFNPGERMYRTGDIARWLPDGNVEYLGRIDHQVKIRGYRIELGEIAETMKKHPFVSDAAVIDRTGSDGSKYLCAYLVAVGDVTDGECREHLHVTLPSYMVPSHFVRLDALPLTPNGKLNRGALPEPVLRAGLDDERSYTEPGTELEQALAGIWGEVLGREQVGIHDDFFHLGGDSIVLLRLASRIHNQLGMETELKELYTHRTISELAAYLSQSSGRGQTQAIKEGLQLIEAFQESARTGRFFSSYASNEIDDFFPLSKIQQSMVYYSMLKPDQPIYHDQFFFPVAFRPWDSSLFERIARNLAQRHAILRTVFDIDSLDEPVQIVLTQAKPDVAVEDLRHMAADEQRDYIELRKNADLKVKYLVDGALLWRLSVFRLGEESAVVFLSFHHAVLDGWSVAVFQQEFIELYNHIAAGGLENAPDGLEPAPLRFSYKDYVALNAYKQADARTEQFWTTFLSGYTRGKLPFNLARKPLDKDGSSTIIRRTLAPELSGRLEQQSGKYGCTVRDLCLAAHLYLLRVITGEADIITGLVSHDRLAVEDGDRILGCFLNSLPIRMQLDKREEKQELVRKVAETVYRMNAHEAFLSDIARMIGERTDPALNPIFDTLFNYTEFHVLDFTEVQKNIQVEENDGLELRSSEMTNTLLDVEVHRSGGRMNVQIKYSPQYFYQRDMDTVFTFYVRILEKLSESEFGFLDSAELMLEEEKAKQLHEWNAPVHELPEAYTEGLTLHALFEEQAARTPDAPAVRHRGRTLTYVQLESEANRLARHLAARGVRSGDHVALITGRGSAMITGMLAILKAGAAYVPIDPDYPAGRKTSILQNAEATAVLADQAYPDLEDFGHERLILMSDPELAEVSTQPLKLDKDSRDLAYIIYTSGSTGTPKGVMIEHRSAVNLVSWVNTRFEVGTHDRLLFLTSMCFDLSVYDIFGMLAAGGTVVVAEREDVLEPSSLLKLMEDEGVTFWDSVPTTMNHFMHHLEEMLAEKPDMEVPFGLRLVFMSGDWIPVTLPDRIRRSFPRAEVISLGGATEGTVWSNYYPIGNVSPLKSSIPYGVPIGGNAFYILDEDKEPVPWGVAGELYIGGVGVARGYRKDESKTAAAFVPDPFLAGSMMYKTGDLGRLMPDGNMEFLGRKDHQVKIRGYRVELGEIDGRLFRHPGIREAVTIDRQDGQEHRYLCAYIVPSDDTLTQAAIREYLASDLPSYMVPASYIWMDRLPLNANGKVDRGQLPAPADAEGALAVHGGQGAPSNEWEERLYQLWQDILGTGTMSVHDTFFEWGGDSLNVTLLVNRIRKSLHIEVTLQEVFRNPTIRGLADLIQSKQSDLELEPVTAGGSAYLEIVRAPEMEVYPVTSAQKRMYTISFRNAAGLSYNTPVVHLLEGNLQLERVQHALHQLSLRHESLRTGFKVEDGEVVQIIEESPIVDLEFADLTEQAVEQYVQAFVRPFDLGHPPLFRVALASIGHDRHLLMFDMHHIVTDGRSMTILAQEFVQLYEGRALPPLKIQYKDYAVWQQQRRLSESYLKQERFWLEALSGELMPLDLSVALPRPMHRSFDGAIIECVIEPAVSLQVKELAVRSGATLFMILMAAYTILLSKHSGREDLIVGTPVSGRLSEDVEGLIGMFVGTLPMRYFPSKRTDFLTYLSEVKERTLAAFENQEYPLEEIVEQLGVKVEANRNPLFDTMFLFDHYGMQEPELLSSLNVTPYPFEQRTAKMDLTLFTSMEADRLKIRLEYATAIFGHEAAQTLVSDYVKIVEAIASNPNGIIGDIELEESLQIAGDLVNAIEFHF